VLYDAVVVAGGEQCVEELANDGLAVHFLAEAYKHGKPLALLDGAERLADLARLPLHNGSDRPHAPATKPMTGAMDGVVLAKPGAKVDRAAVREFVIAIAQHRHYNRPVDGIPA
jgi:catalase